MVKALVNRFDLRTMAEVGVWKGDFAKSMLESCGGLRKYYMIDPWAPLPDWNKPFNVGEEIFEKVYEEAMKKVAFVSDKVVVLNGRTKDVVDSIPDASLDLAYIDGDHTLRGITIDLVTVFNKVKDEGVLVGDDFHPNLWQHGRAFEPTLVFPFSIYFAEAMDVPIFALPFNQFLIHKTTSLPYSFVDFTGRYGDVSLRKNLFHRGLMDRLRRIFSF